MPEVYVGCGSNIRPEDNLRRALIELEREFGALVASRVYESPAFGFEAPDFLNLVVGFRSTVGADAIEAALSSLENARGRDGAARSGSRTLDLDLLLYGARVDAARRLPRTDILRYPFVLAPLAEIAPGFAHPLTGQRMADAWRAGVTAKLAMTQRGRLDAA
jgi:2-amino-4-hydroxy-6-hydroxymethyldihydropteridine diphosphokinase